MFIVEHIGGESVGIGGIDEWTEALLMEIPRILAHRNDPGVRGRFFQDAVPSEADANAEFRAAMDPELEHLFASAEKILIKDLARIEDGFVAIPDTHVRAWMDALNQARLILGEWYTIEEEDLRASAFDPGDERDVAALKVHFFGAMLHQFTQL